jgi:hypothetical protein
MMLGMVMAATGQSAHPEALRGFPDFLQVRSEFLSAVVTAPASTALAFRTVTRNTPAGRVQISVERAGSSFYVIFARERDGGFPVGLMGDIVIKREVSSGFMQQIKWFLSDDGMSWISMTPRNERTFMDYVVAGSVVRSNFPVNQLVYYFFMQPFSFLHNQTRSLIDWSMVLGTPKDRQVLMETVVQAGDSAVGSSAMVIRHESLPISVAILLQAARDSAQIDRYLDVSSQPQAVLAEETKPLYPTVVTLADVREMRPVPAPVDIARRGVAISTASAIFHSGLADGSAFIAHVDNGDGQSALRLAVLPYRTASGGYAFAVLDADAGAVLDWATMVRGRPDAWLRIFRVPLPM